MARVKSVLTTLSCSTMSSLHTWWEFCTLIAPNENLFLSWSLNYGLIHCFETSIIFCFIGSVWYQNCLHLQPVMINRVWLRTSFWKLGTVTIGSVWYQNCLHLQPVMINRVWLRTAFWKLGTVTCYRFDTSSSCWRPILSSTRAGQCNNVQSIVTSSSHWSNSV